MPHLKSILCLFFIGLIWVLPTHAGSKDHLKPYVGPFYKFVDLGTDPDSPNWKYAVENGWYTMRNAQDPKDYIGYLENIPEDNTRNHFLRAVLFTRPAEWHITYAGIIASAKSRRTFDVFAIGSDRRVHRIRVENRNFRVLETYNAIPNLNGTDVLEVSFVAQNVEVMLNGAPVHVARDIPQDERAYGFFSGGRGVSGIAEFSVREGQF